MGPRVDVFRQSGEDRKRVAVVRDGLKRLMRLAVLNYKLEMKSSASFLEISMHQPGGTGRIGIAHRADLYRNGGGNASQELIRDDTRSNGGNPLETLIAGKIFEGQERDAFHRISIPGASGAQSQQQG